MNNPKQQLEAAQRTADAAQEQLDLERRRVERAEKELAALEAALAGADPDEPKQYERLVLSRDATRARRGALQDRVAAAQCAVEAAAGPLAEARQAAARAQLAELAAKRAKKSDELVALVKIFAADFAAQLQAHTDLAHSEATRALERAAGEGLAETPMDRQSADDLPRALASILAELHHLELAEKERVFRATPEGIEKTRREDEARRLEQERQAQRLAEQVFEGKLPDRLSSHVRAATFGGDRADA